MSEAADRHAVRVENVSKSYRVYARPSDILRGMLTRRKSWQEHWALQDVSLAIGRGESVGLVGRNGAGKSTLLKIIAGTLEPTSGSATVFGRCSAILELGIGFHPSFTGRENIYFGGLCLGLTRQEIDRRFDEIVDFAEIGEALERPFGTYSTGMKARLSFSVAASVDAQLMIVDEALSVGDARFQLKCFDRFATMRRNGTTFLLVSHSMPTIIGFCDRAVLIEHGRVLEDGDPQRIDKAYQKLLFTGEGNRFVAPPAAAAAGEDGEALDRFGSGAGRILGVTLHDAAGALSNRLEAGAPFRIEARIRMEEAVPDAVVGFLIRTSRGVDLFGVDNSVDNRFALDLPAGGEATVRLDGRMNLANGDYFVTVGLARRDGTKIDLRYDVIHFSVTGTERQYTTSLVQLDHSVTVALAEDAQPDRMEAGQ